MRDEPIAQCKPAAAGNEHRGYAGSGCVHRDEVIASIRTLIDVFVKDDHRAGAGRGQIVDLVTEEAYSALDQGHRAGKRSAWKPLPLTPPLFAIQGSYAKETPSPHAPYNPHRAVHSRRVL